MSISKTIEAIAIYELLALVPSGFNKNRAKYDFSNFPYQMKIARFSSKPNAKNRIMVFIGEESALELQIRVVGDFDTEF